MCQGERGYLPPQAGCLQHFTCQLNVDSPLPIREGLHPSEGPYAHAAARKLIDAPQAPPGHAIPRLRSVSVGTFVSIVSVGTLVSDVSIVSVVSDVSDVSVLKKLLVKARQGSHDTGFLQIKLDMPLGLPGVEVRRVPTVAFIESSVRPLASATGIMPRPCLGQG